MHRYVGVILINGGWFPSGLDPISINAMDHVHRMSLPRQLIGQPLHKNSIPSKAVGGIEGGDHAEAKGAINHGLLHYPCDLRARLSSSGGIQVRQRRGCSNGIECGDL